MSECGVFMKFLSTRNRCGALTLLLVLGGIITFSSCQNNPETPKTEETRLPVGPLFQDMTSQTGIDFTYHTGEEVMNYAILESLGGGLALIDYDGDGLLDIFLPGGGYYAGPDKKQIKGLPSKLFKNMGHWRFKDVTAETGIDGQPNLYTHGAAVGDYDRDGWPDLLVTGYGRLVLFHNVPDGKGGRKFVDVTQETGLLTGKHFWSTSAAFADFDGDGYPDLYVCQYVNWSWENNPACSGYNAKVKRDVCPPKSFLSVPHALYQNDGKGHFVDVTEKSGIRCRSKDGKASARKAANPAHGSAEGAPVDGQDEDFGKGLGVLVVDVNDDHKPDIYVANDTTRNFLYINRSRPGTIRFEELGMEMGVAKDDFGNDNGSMGTDAGDPFGTGRASIWVANYEGELHALYKNVVQGSRHFFNYATRSSGIAAIGQLFVGFGTGFIDLDNDGWEDIIISNGHVIRHPYPAKLAQEPVLFWNENKGKFREIKILGGPYFQKGHRGRGLALGDLDNDGRLDVVVSHVEEPVAILRNISPSGNHWLGVELLGQGKRDLVGTRLVLEANGQKLTRFIKGGGSYMSASDLRRIFGLGQSSKAGKLTIEWATGEPRVETWDNLVIDSYHRLVQGTGTKQK
jgi:hypothetical protein